MASVTGRPRGRPPKQRYVYPIAIGSYPTLQQISHIRAQLSSWQLSSHQLDSLTTLLADAAAHCSYGRALRKILPARTNRAKVDMVVLLRDCANAWHSVIGQPLTAWQATNRHGHKIEPPAFRLARIVYSVCTGKQLLTDLRRHAKKAKNTTIS